MSANDLKPEEKARVIIDKWLTAAGWEVVSRANFSTDINAQACKENLMEGNKEADYILYLSGSAIAVIEAKKADVNLLSPKVIEQAENYATILPSTCKSWCDKVPFIFLANGKQLLFRDLRDQDSDYIDLNCHMYTPKDLAEKASLKGDYVKLPAVMGVGPGKLRQCQHDAISNIEVAFKKGKSRCLLNLATGSGKTFTACMLSYRALTYTNVNHILYLVDRNNLGKQTLDEFKSFKLTENGNPFTSIYEVLRLRKPEDALNSSVTICTIQRLFSVLSGEEYTDIDDDDEDKKDEDVFDSEESEEVAESDKIKVDATKAKFQSDLFDLIIIDECHRSIYGKWQKVLEYFNKAKIVGLTATPTPQAGIFFDCLKGENLVPTCTYSMDQSYADGVNVPPRIYRILTAVSEDGGKISAGDEVVELNKRTNQSSKIKLSEDEKYKNTDLDRSVVNPAQVKLVIEKYRDIIYTEFFPDRKENWNYIPKTLFFAKTDKHADLIVNTIKEVFKDKFNGNLPSNFVRKITCSEPNPNQIIRDFRNEKDFRIGVTVTLVATGTDITPLEILVFMKDIHSSVLYTQMKGRGCRSISDDKLKLVTPNANTKDCYFLVDAVGVTLSEKRIPDITPVDGNKKKLSLEHVLEELAHGYFTDENFQFLAERLSTIANRTPKTHQIEFEKLVQISLKDLSKNIFEKLADPNLPPFININDPNKERNDIAPDLINKPEARELLLQLQAGYLKILLPGDDHLVSSGFSIEEAKDHIAVFEKFLNDHADDIEALRIIHNDESGLITPTMLLDLRDKLGNLNPIFRESARIWDDYFLLNKNSSNGKNVGKLEDQNERKLITNLIALIRFAFGKTDELQSISGLVNQRFGLYLGQRIGTKQRTFDDKQREVLRKLADYVLQRGCVSKQDFFKDKMQNLFIETTKIFDIKNIDVELNYFSKFLLNIKEA